MPSNTTKINNKNLFIFKFGFFISTYFPDCEEGFLRYGSRCYKSVGRGRADILEEKCNQFDSNLWSPRRVGDVEAILSLFP